MHEIHEGLIDILVWILISPTQLFVTLFMLSRGHFKNTYALLNLRALTLSHANKTHIFQCMGTFEIHTQNI